MTASGTGAVESMLAALVPESGRLLVVENGVYGDRLAQIWRAVPACARSNGWPLDEALDLDAIRSYLDVPTGKPQFTHMAVVHHETTTGRLQ